MKVITNKCGTKTQKEKGEKEKGGLWHTQNFPPFFFKFIEVSLTYKNFICLWGTT